MSKLKLYNECGLLFFDPNKKAKKELVTFLENLNTFFVYDINLLEQSLSKNNIVLLILNDVVFNDLFISKIEELKSKNLLDDNYLLFIVNSYDTEMIKKAFYMGRTEFFLLPLNIELFDCRMKQLFEDLIKIKELKNYYNDAEAVLNSIPDFYYRINLSGDIVDYRTNNKSYLYSNKEAIINKNFEDIYTSSVAENLIKISNDSYKNNKTMSYNFLVKNNYRKFFYEAKFFPHAERKEISIFLRDTTDAELAYEEKINIEKINCYKKTVDSIYKEINQALSLITGAVQFLKLIEIPQAEQESLLLIEQNTASIELIIKKLSSLY